MELQHDFDTYIATSGIYMLSTKLSETFPSCVLKQNIWSFDWIRCLQNYCFTCCEQSYAVDDEIISCFSMPWSGAFSLTRLEKLNLVYTKIFCSLSSSESVLWFFLGEWMTKICAVAYTILPKDIMRRLPQPIGSCSCCTSIYHLISKLGTKTILSPSCTARFREKTLDILQLK